MKLQPLAVRDSGDLEAAFAAATREGADALLVVTEGIFVAPQQHIVNLATRERLPTIYGAASFVRVGGLMSYSTKFLDVLRRAGGQVAKILKGVKPADIPIEQAAEFAMVINLRTAKALGLTIPPSVLARADQVIE